MRAAGPRRGCRGDSRRIMTSTATYAMDEGHRQPQHQRWASVLLLLGCTVLVGRPPSSAAAAAAARSGSGRARLREAIEHLKDEIHVLDPAAAASRLQQISRSSPPPRQNKVNHMVVLFMENRPLDHFFGCMDLPGLDGIPAGGRLIPRHPTYPGSNASAGFVNVTCGTAKYVCDKPPAYSTWDSKFAPGAP